MKKCFLFLVCILLSADFCLAGVSVTGELTRRHAASPGGKYQGEITVKNTGDSPAEVRLYQADYLFYADGRNLYGEPGSAPRSNAPWTSAGPAQLTVPPQGRANFHYTIQVPSRSDLRGSFWSLLMIEPLAAPPPEVRDEKGKISVGLQTVIRYAVQIVTDIEGGGEANLAFTDRRLMEKNGRRIFQVDVENTGELRLSPLSWLDLYGADGTPAGRFESSRKGIYPGCSVRHLFDLTEVPPGQYTALVVLDNEDDNVFGGQFEIDLR